MRIPISVVPADPALIPAAAHSREAQILRVASLQIFGDPSKPGSGLNPAYSDHGRAMCIPVLVGTVSSLRACGSPIVGGAA